MDLSAYLRVIRQRWAVVVACGVVGALAVWLVTPSDTGKSVPYTAVATLVQTPGGAVSTVVDPYVSEASLETIALFVKTGEIPERTAEVLGYEGDPRLLANQITVNTDPYSGSLTISTTSRDGERAADVANAFADQTVTYFGDQSRVQREAEIAALEGRMVEITGALAAAEAALADAPDRAELQAQQAAQSDRYASTYAELQDLRAASAASPSQVAVLQRAAPVVSASAGSVLAPVGKPARVVLGGLIGLLLGVGLALLLERADARIRTRNDVTDSLRVPVIADVPQMTRAEQRTTAIAIVAEPLKSVAEAYRNARSALLLTPSPTSTAVVDAPAPSRSARRAANETEQPRVVLVTSGHAREGKSTTAANLAAGLAEVGRTVLVLDADFRAPNVHRFFDVVEGPGLADHLADPAGLPLEAVVRPTNVPGVSLVTAGAEVDSPAILPSKMRPVVARARELADVVIIDSAPMLHANDALDLIPAADTVVLVVRSGRLTVAGAARMAELLNRFQVPVLGAVLVASRSMPKRWGYGYGAYYGYGQRSSDSAGERGRGRRALREEPDSGESAPATLDDAVPSSTTPQQLPVE